MLSLVCLNTSRGEGGVKQRSHHALVRSGEASGGTRTLAHNSSQSTQNEYCDSIVNTSRHWNLSDDEYFDFLTKSSLWFNKDRTPSKLNKLQSTEMLRSCCLNLGPRHTNVQPMHFFSPSDRRSRVAIEKSLGRSLRLQPTTTTCGPSVKINLRRLGPPSEWLMCKRVLNEIHKHSRVHSCLIFLSTQAHSFTL